MKIIYNVGRNGEGACFLVAGADGQGTCRTKVCADIPNGKTSAAYQGVNNCFSNGTACIAKANCSTYTSKVACNSKGSDGIFVWTETTTGKCSLMTSCASAGTDSNPCTLANDRCQLDTKTKSCIDHTCASYAAQVSNCKYFLTWDQKKYNICSSVNNVCTATDVATLKEGDCYTLSNYLYSWNLQALNVLNVELLILHQTILKYRQWFNFSRFWIYPWIYLNCRWTSYVFMILILNLYRKDFIKKVQNCFQKSFNLIKKVHKFMENNMIIWYQQQFKK